MVFEPKWAQLRHLQFDIVHAYPIKSYHFFTHFHYDSFPTELRLTVWYIAHKCTVTTKGRWFRTDIGLEPVSVGPSMRFPRIWRCWYRTRRKEGFASHKFSVIIYTLDYERKTIRYHSSRLNWNLNGSLHLEVSSLKANTFDISLIDFEHQRSFASDLVTILKLKLVKCMFTSIRPYPRVQFQIVIRLLRSQFDRNVNILSGFRGYKDLVESLITRCSFVPFFFFIIFESLNSFWAFRYRNFHGPFIDKHTISTFWTNSSSSIHHHLIVPFIPRKVKPFNKWVTWTCFKLVFIPFHHDNWREANLIFCTYIVPAMSIRLLSYFIVI